MEQQLLFFAIAALLIGLGSPRMLFPEWVHNKIEGLRYAYPPEPSRFRLISIRTSGIVCSILGLGLIWVGITQ
jgi:hypothetical protein